MRMLSSSRVQPTAMVTLSGRFRSPLADDPPPPLPTPEFETSRRGLNGTGERGVVRGRPLVVALLAVVWTTGPEKKEADEDIVVVEEIDKKPVPFDR